MTPPALVVDSDRKEFWNGTLGIPDSDGAFDVSNGALGIFGVRCGRADKE